MKVRSLSAALRKIAEEEINETPGRLATDLKTLRDWLKENSHLCAVQPPDQWLIAFLRSSKYNMEKTKAKLEKYYKLKHTVPEIYANRDPFDPKIQELLKLGLFLPVRRLENEDSPRIIIVRSTPLSKSQYNWFDLGIVTFMILEILLLEDDNVTIVGEEILSDLKDVGFGTLAQFTLPVAKKSFTCVDVLTLRLKGIHIINSPRGVKIAIAFLKLFLSEKLKKRVYAYNDEYDGIYEFTPKNVLPVEYGGRNGNVQDLIDYWKAKTESYRDWFLQHELKPLEESKNLRKNRCKSVKLS